jgi:hypothetical protein
LVLAGEAVGGAGGGGSSGGAANELEAVGPGAGPALGRHQTSLQTDAPWVRHRWLKPPGARSVAHLFGALKLVLHGWHSTPGPAWFASVHCST